MSQEMGTTPTEMFQSFLTLLRTHLAAGTPLPAAGVVLDGLKVSPAVGKYKGGVNVCATCGLETRDAKYCPFCGPELVHVAPESRCPHCTEVNYFIGAKFCGWCGKPLEPGANP